MAVFKLEPLKPTELSNFVSFVFFVVNRYKERGLLELLADRRAHFENRQIHRNDQPSDQYA
jgi:hypothetical protein